MKVQDDPPDEAWVITRRALSAQPKQVMAYQPVVTPVRAEPRVVCTCRDDSDMSSVCDLHHPVPSEPR